MYSGIIVYNLKVTAQPLPNTAPHLCITVSTDIITRRNGKKTGLSHHGAALLFLHSIDLCYIL